MEGLNELKNIAIDSGSLVKENEPMSLHTTFNIGGKTALFIQPNSPQAFIETVRCAHKLSVPLNLVGNGSNMLVQDEALDLVFINLSNAYDKIVLSDDCMIECGAGVNLSRLCSFAMENSLTGLEFAFGIPGSVGGAVFMNAGAYEGEIGSVIVSCKYIDECGNEKTLQKSEMALSYRNSIFKTNKGYITSVTLKLQKGKKEEISNKMKDYMQRRRDKQPLEYPSAGSFFKRPQGHFAGALIEGCGLKGKTIGKAQISEKHAGFIINLGGATCKDVIELMRFTQDTVLREKGVKLEPEVLMIKDGE